jgi:hypothetical protein
MRIPIVGRWIRSERDPGSRFYRESFEFVAWRFQDCREKMTTAGVQSGVLIILDVALILLGRRTLSLMQGGAARGNDGGLFGMTLAVIAVALVLSCWRLWHNGRRILSLQGEIRKLQVLAGDAPA